MLKFLLTLLRAGAFGMLAAAAVGFLLYARTAASQPADPESAAEGIVAFTGGTDRITTAVALLEAGRGDRLLISGVNPDSPIDDIRTRAEAEPALFECCVDLGFEAADTLGNARETTAWARAHGFSSVIVVTSDYHMARALLELRTAAPELELIPYAVTGPSPWTHPDQARRWMSEYVKYAAVYVREGLMDTVGEAP